MVERAVKDRDALAISCPGDYSKVFGKAVARIQADALEHRARSALIHREPWIALTTPGASHPNLDFAAVPFVGFDPRRFRPTRGTGRRRRRRTRRRGRRTASRLTRLQAGIGAADGGLGPPLPRRIVKHAPHLHRPNVAVVGRAKKLPLTLLRVCRKHVLLDAVVQWSMTRTRGRGYRTGHAGRTGRRKRQRQRRT